MPRKSLRAVSLCVLSRLAAGTLQPKRHHALYLAGWLVARAVNGSSFIQGKVV